MASGPWTRQRESPATTLDARPRAAQPSRQPPHGPRRPHASSPRCAGSARPAVGRRRARTRRRVYGRNCVGRDGSCGRPDETGPDRCLSCHLVRRGVRRGGGPASVTEVRDPRHPGHRGLRRESDDGPETRPRCEEAGAGGPRPRARPRGARAETPSPYREGIQQLCVCAFFHSLTRLM
jgi:hypothetical protein